MQEFAREVSLRRERLPPEPASSVDPATVVLISLRLPSGERLDRRFHISDQLQSLYDFAYTSDSVPRRFTLVTNFPKKELHCPADGGPSLGELSLGPKSVVFMKDESD
ncbi:FAS-associated factor 2 [Geodia barretti]|uniref:FAS-associated factor 2 n=1 Tax=Geodia barretti TaxID=519541 RepID=A0AA35SD63_GEOBA|nr:FAS-associated factor 2 [Geodia barretti]